jgi:uncharacterized damage-inducible protein DinB
MTNAERTAKIAQYGDAYRILTEALAKFPKEMWRYKPSEADWSIHEVVVHITDSEANSYVRARRLIAEPGLSLMAYDENQWSSVLEYQNLDTEDAVELFRWLRSNTHKLIQNLPEATWAHTAFHPESGTITLEDWLDTYASHVPDHIGQMEAVLESWIADNK